ncbi:MAG: energy-coupling factor transporter ATPase [Ruminococcaceae bacterium]|nr:energy-coupling factor transporter ATPase [Oscillospiraceae bacterium]
MPKEIIISAENISFEYPTDDMSVNHAAVSNVSIAIEKGSFVAILGHNGSGKSTLAKLFNGILVPTEGKIFVKGMDTSDDDLLFELRKTVGMVFQNPDNQLVATIVEEDVAFAPENLGVQPAEIRKRVDKALETVGMKEYASHAPHKLSGGQKQRVAIAGILAMEPECIVLDESTAMLDPAGRAEIMKTIKRLNENGMTVILITHYMDEAAEADRIIVMNDGKVEADGAPRKIFSEPGKLSAIGLDVPQITELTELLSSSDIIKNKFSFPKGITDEDEAADYIERLFDSFGAAVRPQ